jgi:transposase
MDAFIADELARRDRFRRHRWRALTLEQRVEEMMRLQQRRWDTLRMNPQAYDLWLRREWRARVTTPPDRVPDAS